MKNKDGGIAIIATAIFVGAIAFGTGASSKNESIDSLKAEVKNLKATIQYANYTLYQLDDRLARVSNVSGYLAFNVALFRDGRTDWKSIAKDIEVGSSDLSEAISGGRLNMKAAFAEHAKSIGYTNSGGSLATILDK